MNYKILFPLVLAATGLFFGGCASPAQSNSMVAPGMGSVTKHAEAVSINVTGGSPTTATSASQISNEDFASALSESIRQSGLFSKIVPTGQADDYHLDVAIVRLQQPMMGFSMTATIETNWSLVKQSDRTVVWRKAITSSHTAKTGEAFAGVKRLRLATEGAARANIKDAITQLSAVTIP